MRKHLAQTVLACFFVYVVWGTTYPAIRLMLAPPGGEGLPLFFATGGRLLIAGIALLIVGQFSRQGRAATRHLTRKQVSAATCSGLFLCFGTAALVATAAQRLPAGAVASYMATAPIWAVLMTSAVTRSLPRLRVTLGLLLGFAGVITLTGSTSSSDRTGVICALAGAVIWAFGSWHTSYTQNFPRHIWISGGIGQLTSGIALICVAISRSEEIHLPLPLASTASLLAFAYLAGVSLAGLTAYSWLLKNRNPLVATTHAFINPLVAACLGAVLLSERLTLRLLLSAGMIGVGAVLAMSTAQLHRRTRKPVRRRFFVCGTRSTTSPENRESPNKLENSNYALMAASQPHQFGKNGDDSIQHHKTSSACVADGTRSNCPGEGSTGDGCATRGRD